MRMRIAIKCSTTWKFLIFFSANSRWFVKQIFISTNLCKFPSQMKIRGFRELTCMVHAENHNFFEFILYYVLLLDDSTGLYSVYTEHEGKEIMFHVSTLLPYTPNNRYQEHTNALFKKNTLCVCVTLPRRKVPSNFYREILTSLRNKK